MRTFSLSLFRCPEVNLDHFLLVVIDFEIWNTFLDLIFFQTGTRLPVGSGFSRPFCFFLHHFLEARLHSENKNSSFFC